MSQTLCHWLNRIALMSLSIKNLNFSKTPTNGALLVEIQQHFGRLARLKLDALHVLFVKANPSGSDRLGRKTYTGNVGSVVLKNKKI